MAAKTKLGGNDDNNDDDHDDGDDDDDDDDDNNDDIDGSRSGDNKSEKAIKKSSDQFSPEFSFVPELRSKKNGGTIFTKKNSLGCYVLFSNCKIFVFFKLP